MSGEEAARAAVETMATFLAGEGVPAEATGELTAGPEGRIEVLL